MMVCFDESEDTEEKSRSDFFENVVKLRYNTYSSGEGLYFPKS